MIRDRKYLTHLRHSPCIITGMVGTDYQSVDPAHIGTAGTRLKSSDDEALPLLHSLHLEAHSKGEISMWRDRSPDWLIRAALRAYARELYRQYKVEHP